MMLPSKLMSRLDDWTGGASRRLCLVLLLLLLAYAGLLRAEAFHRTYGPLSSAPIFEDLQGAVASVAAWLRPEGISFDRGLYPYREDPKSYLDGARRMRSFYGGALREPLFVFATKAGVWVTGGQDIAISAVSSVASWLLVGATFLLGRAVGGKWVGLLAAIPVAVEPQLVGWGAMGYRDDTFALVTVLFACSAVRFRAKADGVNAALLSASGAVAILTRITSFSFVLPVVAVLAVAGGGGSRRRRRLLAVGTMAAVIVLVAPFLVNCWVEYGDPFYSINWHTERFYSGRDWSESPPPGGTLGYLAELVKSEPVRFADRIFRGMTVYPWSSQWAGVEAHWTRLGAMALKTLSAVGFLICLWVPAGRIMLLTIGGALLPFATTWEVFARWRFTLPAVPFLAVCAAVGVVMPATWLASWIRTRRPDPGARSVVSRVLVSAAICGVFAMLYVSVPVMSFVVDLAMNRPGSVAAESRDPFFFPSGWFPALVNEEVTFRYVKGDQGTIWAPVPKGGAYRFLLRLDPPPNVGDAERNAAQLVVELSINNQWHRRFRVEWAADEVGRYEFQVRPGVLRRGLNRFDFRVIRGAWRPRAKSETWHHPDSAFRVWYLRFQPLGRHQGAAGS